MVDRKLPAGWEWRKLGDIGKIFSGSTPSTRDNANFDGNIPWITPADLSTHDSIYIERGKRNLSEKGLNSSSATLLPKDTVLFSSRAPVGYVAIAANPLATNQGFKNLILNSNEILPEYVYYYLKANKKLAEKYASGTTFLEVSASRFTKIPIVIPPLETQRKIVAILDKAEATQRLRAEADALMQDLAQSVFQEVVGDPMTNPMEWSIVNLGMVCKKITDGTHRKPNYIDSGIPFLSVKNLTKGHLDLTDIKFISQKEHEELIKRCKPEKGDILYTKIGTYGVAEIIDIDTDFSIFVSLALLKPDVNLINPYYLKFILNTPYVKGQADKRIRGIGVPDLHLVEIKQFTIPLPPLDKQDEFVEVVNRMTAIRAHQKSSSDNLDNLFNALTSKAFTGDLIA